MNQQNIGRILKILIIVTMTGLGINVVNKRQEKEKLINQQNELQAKYNTVKAKNDRLKDPDYLNKKSSLQNSQTSEKEIIFTINEK